MVDSVLKIKSSPVHGREQKSPRQSKSPYNNSVSPKYARIIACDAEGLLNYVRERSGLLHPTICNMIAINSDRRVFDR